MVGAIQRQVNPLPEGRYWIDIFGAAKRTAFLEWRAKHKDSVRVRGTEENAGPPLHAWFLFVVDHPVPFPPGLGYPTIADASVKSKDDTVQRPDPEPHWSTLDPFKGAAEVASNRLLTLALWLGLGYFAIQALTKSEPDTQED